MENPGESSKSSSSSFKGKPGAASSANAGRSVPPTGKPPAGTPPSTGTPGPQNELLGQYNAYKTAIRWIIVALILMLVTYGIVAAWSDSAPQSVLAKGKLGTLLAANGQVVALTHRIGYANNILVSMDSGK